MFHCYNDSDENCLAYINSVSHYASLLSSMGVTADSLNIATVVLNGIADHYQYMSTALYGIVEEDISIELVQRGRFQVVQKSSTCSSENVSALYLPSRNSVIRKKCKHSHCG